MNIRTVFLSALFMFFAVSASAQIPRQRVTSDGPVDPLFRAPDIVNLPSLASLPQGNLNVTIHHTFGALTDGVDGLFGLDAPANIRFGADYGITDRFSLGVGRSRFDKVYDFRAKMAIMRQTESGSSPVAISAAVNLGIMTLKNGYDFGDRRSLAGMVLIGKRFSDELSVQLTPTWVHFGRVDPELDNSGSLLETETEGLALGIAARWAFSEGVSVAMEYIPVLGDRSKGTRDNLAVSLNMDTGGHVFQLFITTSQGMTPQHVINRNRDDFFGSDARFGFNINRVFNFGAW